MTLDNIPKLRKDAQATDNRALGDIQLFRRDRKTQVPRRGFESDQTVQRRQRRQLLFHDRHS